MVGDNVIFEVLDDAEKSGNIDTVLPRKNSLVRPAVANIDQAMIIFSIVKPEPNLSLLDRFLVMMEEQEIPCLICFNKMDLAAPPALAELCAAYESCGLSLFACSALTGTGMEAVFSALKGKSTVLAGPSGVGKSTILNQLYPAAQAATATLSKKIERGRHTTRHTEIFCLDDAAAPGKGTYILDTPGFSALFLAKTDKLMLKDCYPEFAPYLGACRFSECVHISEPDCAVKAALSQGHISYIRYDNYRRLYAELESVRKY